MRFIRKDRVECCIFVTCNFFLHLFFWEHFYSAVKNQRKKKAENTTDLPSKPPTMIVYDDLVIKEESDYILIPVGISPDNNEQREGLFSRKSIKSKNFYNIIFYNKKNAKTNLLLNKSAIIKSFNFLEIDAQQKTDITETTETTEKIQKNFWLYRIIKTDTNQDGKLNNLDANIGYISDLSGRNLRQITPGNTQLLDWSVLPAQGEILLKVLNDSDQDQKFTEKDKTDFIKVNLNNPKIGTNLINNQLGAKNKIIFIRMIIDNYSITPLPL